MIALFVLILPFLIPFFAIVFAMQDAEAKREHKRLLRQKCPECGAAIDDLAIERGAKRQFEFETEVERNEPGAFIEFVTVVDVVCSTCNTELLDVGKLIAREQWDRQWKEKWERREARMLAIKQRNEARRLSQ